MTSSSESLCAGIVRFGTTAPSTGASSGVEARPIDGAGNGETRPHDLGADHRPAPLLSGPQDDSTPTRDLRLDEPEGLWSVLKVPADPHTAMLHAAFGIVAAAPESDGKVRATERLNVGDEAAVLLACEILKRATEGG